MDILPLALAGLVILFGAALIVFIVRARRKTQTALADLAELFGEDELLSGEKTKAQIDGVDCFYHYYQGDRNSPSQIHLYVSCPTTAEFRIRKEVSADGFFRRLGVTVEVQTGETTRSVKPSR